MVGLLNMSKYLKKFFKIGAIVAIPSGLSNEKEA
jgi:hypothetical protein